MLHENANYIFLSTFLVKIAPSLIEDPQSNLKINASEVALLQRLLYPELPIKSNGELLGPKKVWLKILFIIETWIATQLEKELSSLKMLREIYR